MRSLLCSDNESCVKDADLIVTCTNGDEQIIRPEWFKPGAFGVGIEGGCAYTAEALHQADKFIVDDVALAEYFDQIGRRSPNGRRSTGSRIPGWHAADLRHDRRDRGRQETRPVTRITSESSRCRSEWPFATFCAFALGLSHSVGEEGRANISAGVTRGTNTVKVLLGRIGELLVFP